MIFTLELYMEHIVVVLNLNLTLSGAYISRMTLKAKVISLGSL